jgi:hypothetical protein
MEAAEDDELQLLRISEGLVADLQKLLKRVLWKKSQSEKADELKVHRIVKLRDLGRLINKVKNISRYLGRNTYDPHRSSHFNKNHNCSMYS